MMRLSNMAATLLLAGVAIQPVSAGVYTDDLTKCIVAKSTDGDKIGLVRWIFAAMSSHPAVRDLSSATQAQRDDLNRQAGALISRLLTADCRPQSVLAIKYEGFESIKASFGVLGQIAVQGLFGDPEVTKSMSSVVEGMDKEKLQALAKEAGVAAPPVK